MKLNRLLKDGTALSLAKGQILWRVYVIWFFRRILPLIILQIVVLALALQIFAKNVFVSKVLQNIAQVSGGGYWAVLKYLVASFLITRPLTQIAILLLLGISALLLRDLGRVLFTYKAMRAKK